MVMRKKVAGKIKYVSDSEIKICCPVNDKILNETKEEKVTDKKNEHTR